MIYEYCDEIKNSGMDKSFASSFSYESYLERAIEATYIAMTEVNSVLQEAGMIELIKFRNNTITEASASEIFAKVKKKIKDLWIKFCEKIKGLFAKLQGWYENRLDGIKKKVLPRFKDLDLRKYKKALDKIDSKIHVEYFKANDRLDTLEKKIAGIDTKAIGTGDPYVYIASEVGLSKVTNMETAKTAIDKKLGDPYKVSGSWLKDNQKFIVDVLQGSVRKLGDEYREAKKVMDETTKALNSVDETDDSKDIIRAEFELGCAKQNLLLYLAQLKRSEFIHLCMLVNTVCIVCNPGNEEKIKNESTKFNTEFVDKVFNS